MTELLGTTVLWIMVALGVIGLVAMPLLRAAAMLAIGARLAGRALASGARARSLGAAPERPLELAGLTPGLADLARQTRHLADELRRGGEQAASWPTTRVDEGRSCWRSFLDAGGFGPQIEVAREVWDWLRVVERLSPAEREHLESRGVEPEAVRALLLGELLPAEQVRALAGLLWSIDERLSGGATPGYRGSHASRPSSARGSGKPTAAAPEDDDAGDALRERRRRWAELLERQGPALSRMAASYTRGRGEQQEDLEQDIALALWQALPSFRGESSLKTFALRVARYCCYRHIRRRGRAQVEPFVDEIGDPGACVETWLGRTDTRARLEQALARLPDALESTLALRLEGKSYGEIAAALGISERNVSVRLTRARRRIERQLASA